MILNVHSVCKLVVSMKEDRSISSTESYKISRRDTKWNVTFVKSSTHVLYLKVINEKKPCKRHSEKVILEQTQKRKWFKTLFLSFFFQGSENNNI